MSLILNNISKKYGSKFALQNINFEINRGEVVGFLGPNGAGKSTTMKIIAGAIQPTSGSVFLNDLSIEKEPDRFKRSFGYLSEGNPLYEDMYVLEYLRFNAGIYHVDKRRLKEIIEALDLGEVTNKKIHECSKGYKQRVGLAAALLHNPELLILDEPTSGLDPNQLATVRLLIRELGKNKMVLFSSHIMQEILAICDRVILINNGEIVADKTIEDLKNYGEQSIQVEFDRGVEALLINSIPNLKDSIREENNHWTLKFNTQDDMRPIIFDFANENHLKILKMNRLKKPLEEIFQALTNDLF